MQCDFSFFFNVDNFIKRPRQNIKLYKKKVVAVYAENCNNSTVELLRRCNNKKILFILIFFCLINDKYVSD